MQCFLTVGLLPFAQLPDHQGRAGPAHCPAVVYHGAEAASLTLSPSHRLSRGKIGAQTSQNIDATCGRLCQ